MLGRFIPLALSMTALAAGCTSTVPPEAEGWLRASRDALRRGDNASAIDSAKRFIDAYPRAEQAGEGHYLRGLAEYRTQQPGAAKADLVRALALTRRKDLTGLIHMELGNIAYQAGDLKAAEAHFRATLAGIPAATSPADEAAFLLGCILQRHGRWSEADLFFDRVMHLFDGQDIARRSAERVHAARWSIQVGAFEQAAPATALEAALRKALLPARIDLELRNQRMLRLVRVGSYPTYDAAQADLPKVQALSPQAFTAPAR